MKKYLSKEKWSYLLYTMNHPIDGFYWIRHRDRGSVPIAVIMVILFSLSFSLNRINANFIVNDVEPTTVDSLEELSGICPETWVAGDCNTRQGNITSAVREGFYAAMNV